MTLFIATSTIADGSMKPIHDSDIPAVTQSRELFLKQHAIAPKDTTLLKLTYDRNSYCEYKTVDTTSKGDGITRPSTITSDALVVTKPEHTLLLPLADCIGAVIYDPVRHILMVSHLGRHNLEQNGGFESVRYLAEQHNSSPNQLEVWLSPAAGKANYPLFAFNNHSLHEVAIEQLVTAGVQRAKIAASSIDSSEDPNYFSHSQFLQGNRKTDGRFAIVAKMRIN